MRMPLQPLEGRGWLPTASRSHTRIAFHTMCTSHMVHSIPSLAACTALRAKRMARKKANVLLCVAPRTCIMFCKACHLSGYLSRLLETAHGNEARYTTACVNIFIYNVYTYIYIYLYSYLLIYIQSWCISTTNERLNNLYVIYMEPHHDPWQLHHTTRILSPHATLYCTYNSTKSVLFMNRTFGYRAKCFCQIV